GMAARELLDGERTRAARKIAQQESLQPGEVGFFAWPYGSGMVSKISHVSVAELPPLTVRQQGRIVEMRKRIERAQREALAGAQELAVRTVQSHPCDAQRVSR